MKNNAVHLHTARAHTQADDVHTNIGDVRRWGDANDARAHAGTAHNAFDDAAEAA